MIHMKIEKINIKEYWWKLNELIVENKSVWWKDLKINSIFCWDEIHLNFCLCWSWNNFFFDCLRTTSFIVIFQSLEKLYLTFLLQYKIAFNCFETFLHFLLEENQREWNKWKCIDKMLFTNITAFHFKKGIKLFKMELESSRFTKQKWNKYKISLNCWFRSFSSGNNSKNSSK